MQPEFEVKTPSLAASTELLVMAPIRRGFVPSLDTITYKSRTKLLLKMLLKSQDKLRFKPRELLNLKPLPRKSKPRLLQLPVHAVETRAMTKC